MGLNGMCVMCGAGHQLLFIDTPGFLPLVEANPGLTVQKSTLAWTGPASLSLPDMLHN